jgi:hypothetical protein
MKLFRHMFFFTLISVLLSYFLSAGTAAAVSYNYTTLTLPTLNTDISTWTDGWRYDTIFPGEHTWNDVPFNLAVDVNGNKAFYTATLTIPVNVYGVTKAYSMINSSWGSDGAIIGKMEFLGSNGAYYTVDLKEGTNVRDHFWGGYCNTIDGVNAVDAFNNNPGQARLDMQIYTLPIDFVDEYLTGIVFTSYLEGSQYGNPFIAAATVATPVPIPGAIWLLGSGLVGLVGLGRRIKK